MLKAERARISEEVAHPATSHRSPGRYLAGRRYVCRARISKEKAGFSLLPLAIDLLVSCRCSRRQQLPEHGSRRPQRSGPIPSGGLSRSGTWAAGSAYGVRREGRRPPRRFVSGKPASVEDGSGSSGLSKAVSPLRSATALHTRRGHASPVVRLHRSPPDCEGQEPAASGFGRRSWIALQDRPRASAAAPFP